MTHSSASRSAFISYRRSASFAAQHIRDALRRNGIDAFLDLQIGAGPFPQAIFTEIIRRPYFFVLLEPGTLDGIHHHDDWVRLEIGCALAHRRVLVPLLINGFQFTRTLHLPPEIEGLRTLQAFPVPNHLVDAAITSLCTDVLGLDVPDSGTPSAQHPRQPRPRATLPPTAPESATTSSPVVSGPQTPAPRPASGSPDQPRPIDHLTRGEKAKLRAALMAMLAEENPLRWTVVEGLLFNVVRRVFEPDWRGPQGARAIIEKSYSDFFVSEIGIKAPFDQEEPKLAPPGRRSTPQKVQAGSGAAALDGGGAPVPTAVPARQAAKPQNVAAGKAAKRTTNGSTPAASAATKRPTSARVALPDGTHPEDVRRVRAAMLAKFVLTNPLTLDDVAEIVKNKAPRLHGQTNGSKRRLVEVLRTSFSPFEVFEFERGRHLVYRDAAITGDEHQQARAALDAELPRNGRLHLSVAGTVLLKAMPRVSAPDWAGAGSLSEFLRMFFRDEFTIDDQPGGPYLVRLHVGFLDRLLGPRRSDAAR